MDQLVASPEGAANDSLFDAPVVDDSGAAVVTVDAPQDGETTPILAQSESAITEQVTVSRASGDVLVISVSGEQGRVQIGDTLGPGDVIMTRGEGAVELRLTDGTHLFFDSESRVLIEEPAEDSDKPQFFVIQGEFSVDGGRSVDGPASEVLVRTPVASVTVNGARMIGKAAPEAQANTFVLLPGLGGLAAGTIAVVTSGAPIVIDQPLQGLQVLSLFREPTMLPEVGAALLTSEFGAGVLAYGELSSIPDLAAGDEPGLLAQLGEIFGIGEARAEPLLIPTEGLIEQAEGDDDVLGGAADDLLVDDPDEELGDDGGVDIIDDGVLRFNGAATVNIADGDATVEGGVGDDTLTVIGDPALSNVLIMNGNVDGNALLNFQGGDNVTVTVDEVEQVVVNLGTADDIVTVEDLTQTDISNSTVIFDLGDGNDSLTAVTAEKSITVDGGAGNDTIAGGSQDDQLNGGANTDLLDFSNSTGPVTVDLAAGTSTGFGNDVVTNFENVVGTAQNDTLNGDAQNNSLAGGAGDDQLGGAAGDDTLDGGDGSDTADFSGAAASVTASLGDNTATGDGNDTFISIENIAGSAQDDSLTGNDNSNTLSGAAGADLLTGAGGDDVLRGDVGDDTLAGGDGDDALIGGDGDDTADFSSATTAITADLSDGAAAGQGIDTFDGIENLTGGSEADSLTGDALANVLDGGLGGDTLIGGAGNDTLLGQAGGDTMVGGLGDDVFNGGGGFDRADFTTSADAVNVDLGNQSAVGEGSDQLISIENVIGSAGNDTINGTDTAENFVGRGGNDLLNGIGGDDTLIGADGNDTINGGLGNDSISAGSDNDLVDAGAGDDIIDGEAGSDTLTGGAGNDRFFYDSQINHQDQIQDFTQREDLFQVQSSTDNFENIATNPDGTLIDGQSFVRVAEALIDGTTNLNTNQATFVIDSENKLHFDPDGDGQGTSFEIGTLTTGGGSLAATDFQVQ